MSFLSFLCLSLSAISPYFLASICSFESPVVVLISQKSLSCRWEKNATWPLSYFLPDIFTSWRQFVQMKRCSAYKIDSSKILRHLTSSCSGRLKNSSDSIMLPSFVSKISRMLRFTTWDCVFFSLFTSFLALDKAVLRDNILLCISSMISVLTSENLSTDSITYCNSVAISAYSMVSLYFFTSSISLVRAFLVSLSNIAAFSEATFSWCSRCSSSINSCSFNLAWLMLLSNSCFASCIAAISFADSILSWAVEMADDNIVETSSCFNSDKTLLALSINSCKVSFVWINSNTLASSSSLSLRCSSSINSCSFNLAWLMKLSNSCFASSIATISLAEHICSWAVEIADDNIVATSSCFNSDNKSLALSIISLKVSFAWFSTHSFASSSFLASIR